MSSYPEPGTVVHDRTPATEREPRPARTNVNDTAIPETLRADKQWVVWRYERDPKDTKWTKVPYQAVAGQMYGASSTNPKTWTTFSDAYRYYQANEWVDGLGFVVSDNDNSCAIDLDHCRDPQTGIIDSWALGIVADVPSYWEVSPSGTGLRAFCTGSLPPKGRKTGNVEMYSTGRFLTVTGAKLPGSRETIEACTAQLARVHAAHIIEARAKTKAAKAAEREAQRVSASTSEPVTEPVAARTNGHAAPRIDEGIVAAPIMDPKNLSDDQVISLARDAKNGAKFRRLWSGDTSDYRAQDNDGRSEADAALLGILGFYCRGNRDQMDGLFRKSGLYRDKWDRSDYRDRTLDLALAGVTTFFGDGDGQDFPWLEELKDGPIRLAGTAPQSLGPTQQPAANLQALLAGLSMRGDAPLIDAGNLDLRVVTTQAWNAIELANQHQPFIFKHGGVPVWVGRDDEGRATLAELTQAHIRHILARVATFFQVKIKKTTDDEGEEHQTKVKRVTLPPTHVCTDVLATPDPDLPVIARLIDCPVFAPDGTLQTEPGYHAAGRVYLAIAPGLNIPDVALAPSAEDIQRAKALIVDDLLGDFPFAGPAELANAIALALEQFVRDMIDGPLPLHSFEAPTPGSGKGLLADALLRPSCGRTVGAISQAGGDDEWRKRILAALAHGYPAIQIDNANKPIESGALSMALTIPVFTDRILGVTKMLSVPVRCSWVVTANNPSFSTEVARRTVRTRIDPKVDRPQDREGWRHPELLSWVDDNRGELIWAFCTLVRAWVAAGKPRFTGKALGSFERWSHVIGGILQTVGIPGFLENQSTFYDVADGETAAWQSFVAAWWDAHQDREVGAAALFPLALQTDGIDLGGGQDGSKSQKTRFGMMLGAQRDRVIGGYRVVPTRTARRLQQWRLLPTEGVYLAYLDVPFDPPSHTHIREDEISTGGEKVHKVHKVHTEGVKDVDAERKFEPSPEWQAVPDGYVCPAGGEFRMDFATGTNWGRWPAQSATDQADASEIVDEEISRDTL